jgi:hypothetical protein
MGNMAQYIVSGLSNNRDAWAELKNKSKPYSFNTAKSPYDVWGGQYTAIRPKGATYAHPEGIDAAFEKDMGGLLGLLKEK